MDRRRSNREPHFLSWRNVRARSGTSLPVWKKEKSTNHRERRLCVSGPTKTKGESEMQRKPSLRLLLFLVVSMSMTELLQAQGTPPPFRKLDRAAVTAAPAIVKEDYGVQDYNFTIIPASDFRPFDSATGYTVSVANGALTRTG